MNMKKILIILLGLVLILPLTGCLKTVEVEFIVNGQSLGTVSGKSPLDLSEQAPVIETTTYKFYGWEDEQGNIVDLSQPVESDLKLTAKLVALYKVYWLNEGEVMETQEYEEGEVLHLPDVDIPQSKSDHYVFDKWQLDGADLPGELAVTKDMKISSTFKYTNEVIYFNSNPLVIYGVGAEVRSGINHNMVGTEHVTITTSDPSIATYYDTHIFTHGIGECTFKVQSKSGIIRYLKVIVKEK